MSEPAHTPEPWHWGLHPRKPFVHCLFGAGGETMIAGVGEISQADRRRIVACVNYCAGVLTDDLAPRGLLLIRRDREAHAASLHRDVAAARADADALAAALCDLLERAEVVDENAGELDPPTFALPLLNNARAALARHNETKGS